MKRKIGYIVLCLAGILLLAAGAITLNNKIGFAGNKSTSHTPKLTERKVNSLAIKEQPSGSPRKAKTSNTHTNTQTHLVIN
ncbi:hypothetical protein [Lactobacillus corticis]|uniref:Uncharacterized protein n=1 Tax=Lactobacillus corticis TaxID=2201249 RepID=A0A916VI17_9LACO|nr:hypothetical protein [Lactobacillus corticis]GFZ26848.1 hypothetical protein LCB40_07280 [Lactobacillus corticis]